MITTVILTGILLIILVIASFVSLNILNAQMVSTEFEQAQLNMRLLDSTIQDVSLRPGAGGYVQFNEREGGIGIQPTTDSVSVTIQDKMITFPDLTQLVYSGGTLASAAVSPNMAYTSLRGDLNYAYVNLTQGLDFLRLEQDNGARIKLDYDRVRISSTGRIDSTTNLVQISFIHLIKGSTSGTNIVNVQTQNIKTVTTTWQFSTGAISITATHNAKQSPTPISQTYLIDETPAGVTQTVVLLSEIQILVSIT